MDGDEKVVALKRINLKLSGEVCCFRNVGVRKEYAFESTGRNGETHKGQVFIRGKNISDMNEEELAAFRQEHMSFIFSHIICCRP